MTALFFRSGLEFTGKPVSRTATGGTTLGKQKCSRCGGAGGADKWAHTGWTCFDCNGSGDGKIITVKLYTAEKLAKLTAIAEAKAAKRAAEYAIAQATLRAKTQANQEAFDAEFADVMPWLAEVGYADDDIETRYKEGFLGDMLRCAIERAAWSPAQAAAVRNAYAKAIEAKRVRAASRYVGSIGLRISAEVTVEREASFPRPKAMAPWVTEEVFITTMRDDEGNALIVKSPSFRVPVGARLSIKGTVKDYGDWKGEAQTFLQRVKATPIPGATA